MVDRTTHCVHTRWGWCCPESYVLCWNSIQSSSKRPVQHTFTTHEFIFFSIIVGLRICMFPLGLGLGFWNVGTRWQDKSRNPWNQCQLNWNGEGERFGLSWKSLKQCHLGIRLEKEWIIGWMYWLISSCDVFRQLWRPWTD